MLGASEAATALDASFILKLPHGKKLREKGKRREFAVMSGSVYNKLAKHT